MIGDLEKTPVISIVDDDESIRLALRSLVRSLGYVSNVFASAEEILESSYLNETSCLISDVRIPGMNGIKLQCRPKELNCRTPVILNTAFPAERSMYYLIAEHDHQRRNAHLGPAVPGCSELRHQLFGVAPFDWIKARLLPIPKLDRQKPAVLARFQRALQSVRRKRGGCLVHLVVSFDCK